MMVLPAEEAGVTAMLVVGWLVVTSSGRAVVPGTVCGRNKQENRREREEATE